MPSEISNFLKKLSGVYLCKKMRMLPFVRGAEEAFIVQSGARIAGTHGDNGLRAGLQAGGAPVMWQRAVKDLLPGMKRHVPAGSRVLEVGYGDGILTCFFCRELGWRVKGLDIIPEVDGKATENACRLGVGDCVEFECCLPEDTWAHEGQYDAVFIKTVL